VVSLGVTDADVALALGVTPIALTGFTFFETRLGPWAMSMIDGDVPEVLEVLEGEPNIEYIASLDPDLILGVEQATLLDADVIVMLADQPDAREFVDNDPVLQAVPAVADGRMVIPDTDTRGALTYNTVISVPYLLDQLVPQIAEIVS
jgi:ABC-type Fe3+-hydroxamate transport system substrate-binding protein